MIQYKQAFYILLCMYEDGAYQLPTITHIETKMRCVRLKSSVYNQIEIEEVLKGDSSSSKTQREYADHECA